MRLQNFGLNNVDGMSEYELMRRQIVDRNNARLASLGLLGRTSSATPPPSDLPNRKKRAAPQDDVERRVQPKRNAKKTTSYRDFDNHVIYKRTRPIDSSEDTVHKRLREDDAEYSPSSNHEEEDDEDKLKSHDSNDDSTGYDNVDIYGHSQQYYIHQKKYVAFLQKLLSDTFPVSPMIQMERSSLILILIIRHPAKMRLSAAINVKELTGILHRLYKKETQYVTRMETPQASPLNKW